MPALEMPTNLQILEFVVAESLMLILMAMEWLIVWMSVLMIPIRPLLELVSAALSTQIPTTMEFQIVTMSALGMPISLLIAEFAAAESLMLIPTEMEWLIV